MLNKEENQKVINFEIKTSEKEKIEKIKDKKDTKNKNKRRNNRNFKKSFKKTQKQLTNTKSKIVNI